MPQCSQHRVSEAGRVFLRVEIDGALFDMPSPLIGDIAVHVNANIEKLSWSLQGVRFLYSD